MQLNSQRFSWYLAKLFYDNNSNMAASKESINTAIQILESKASFDSETTTPLHIRVAYSEDKKSIYYDLTNENWDIIKIDRNGVNLESNFDTPLFKRYSQTPQPIPEDYSDSPQVFDEFISIFNVKENDDILLTKVWTIATVIPDIAHTIFNVHGGHDAGKTTLEKGIKQTVDPDKPENLLSINYDKMEFIQQLSHRRIAFYDNLRYKIKWLPEEICKAVTGGGTSKRKLHTDDDDIIYDFKVCVGFNGINMIMNEPDVLRRSIIIKLESIDEANKMSEEEIYARIEELKPKVLSYIFDIVSKAMSIKDTLKLNSIPGLADWAKWCEAISRAMGYPEMEFINAYRRNIEKQNTYVIDTNPFAKAISLLYEELFSEIHSDVKLKFKYHENIRTYRTSGHEFLEVLKGVAFRDGLDVFDKRFPQAVNKIGNQLNIIKPNLKSLGIDIAIKRSTSKEDVDDGFIKNTTIIEMIDIRPLSGNGGDSGDSGDKKAMLIGSKEGDRREEDGEKVKEHTESISTISTTSTTSTSLIISGPEKPEECPDCHR